MGIAGKTFVVRWADSGGHHSEQVSADTVDAAVEWVEMVMFDGDYVVWCGGKVWAVVRRRKGATRDVYIMDRF